MRYIDINLVVLENVIYNINHLYSIFIPNKEGVLYYYRDELSCKINYVVESVTPSNNGLCKFVNISLCCVNPFFEDIDETKVNIAYYQGLIKFPFIKNNLPFFMTQKVKNLIANIESTSNMDLGMRVKFIANGNVKNPSLFNVDTREFFKVNIEMLTGDEITITTHYKNKKVILYRNGVYKNITNLIDYQSTWLKIYDGYNMFRYNADVNINNLDVAIYYRQLRLGVV